MKNSRSDVAVSPYNLDPEVIHQVSTKSIYLCDCTLREAEQSGGVAFTLEEQLRIAHMLDEIGIQQMQVGYPGISEVDREKVKAVAQEHLSADVESLTQIHIPNWRQQIDVAISCGVDIISLHYGTSPVRLEQVLNVSEDQALSTIYNAIKYAKERAPVVSFTSTDSTRTSLDFLIKVYRIAQEAGADRVRFNDTMGAVSPTAFRYLIRKLREVIRVPMGVHCHNDHGLAMASVCAAIEAGVEFIDVTINGLGERSGNSSLDEVVMVLKNLYGFKLPIKTEGLYNLSRTVEEITGMAVPPGKPIVGENAFAHHFDIHVAGVMKNPEVYEPFSPELVGNRRRFPLGNLSGKNAVRYYLRELAIDEKDVDIEGIIKAIRKEADTCKGEVSKERFIAMVQSNTKT